MQPYRLPLKFIGLWVLNLAVLLGLGIGLGINAFLLQTIQLNNLACLYLFLGGLLAGLEEWLIDRWKKRNKPD